jgi:hypothetical protein
MEQSSIAIKDLTFDNVWNLTEEDAFHLVEQIMVEFETRDERNHFTKIIDSAFEFRTVSSTRRILIDSISKEGYKFFKVEGLPTFRGIRKRQRKNVRNF